MDVNKVRKIILMDALMNAKLDGDISVKLSPRERILVMDSLASYSVRVEAHPESSIFTSDETNKLATKIII